MIQRYITTATTTLLVSEISLVVGTLNSNAWGSLRIRKKLNLDYNPIFK
jgi:hypothetical protein